MSDYNTLNHTTWDCKYHIVFIPKYRKKVLFGQVKRRLIPVLQELAARKECRIEEGHMIADHVHLLISIPPKYAVLQSWDL
jgi:putative transposase